MADLAYYVAGLVAIVAAVAKFTDARARPRSPGAVYLCGVLAFLGLSAVLLAPATLRFGAGFAAAPNLTRLIGNAATATAVFCMVGLLAHAAHPGNMARNRVRVQTGVLVGALAAMSVLLLSAGTAFTVDFVNVYATNPLIAAYELVFLGYASWGTAGVVILVSVAARHAERTVLRFGFRLLAGGALFGLAWALWKMTMTTSKLFSGEPVPVEGPVSSVLSTVSITLIALGATMTSWGPRAAHPLLWWRARRAFRRIEPLWTALHEAVPEVAFEHPGAGMEFRLYRRIVEIRDCSLSLRVYFHPQVPSWVADALGPGARDTESAVITEAASLAAALEAHRVRHRYHDDPATAATPRELDADVGAEGRWLVRVAKAFTESPVVSDVRDRVRAELGSASAALDRGPDELRTPTRLTVAGEQAERHVKP